MAFELLQARSVDDPADELYPVPTEVKNSFRLEASDGEVVSFSTRAAIAAVVKGERRQETGRSERINGTVAITDSRVVFVCTEFRTGDSRMQGYGAGGIVVALAFNAASKSAAVRKTRGYSLVGHIRYEWLAAVLAQDYKWGKAQNLLKLTFSDPTDAAFRGTLVVFPPGRTSARDFGRQIVQRAALAQSAATTGEDAERLREFAETLPSKPLSDVPGVVWFLPRTTAAKAV